MSIAISINTQLDENPLQQLEGVFADKIQQVNHFLQTRAYSDVSVLPLISSHIINSGGKRIRPLLTLAAAQLCGYASGNRDVRMAACVEFLHTATLLHDDVIDESLLRRNKPTAHTIWGNQMSVLTGDFLFVKLFELLVEDGDLKVLQLFVQTTQKIVEGEVLQIKARSSARLEREAYFSIIQSKTAVLFGTALELGGMVAQAGFEQMNALKTYAHHIGIAFQLIDDVLDYTAEQPILGKPIGNDFFEGQITFPLIVLFEKLQDQPDLLLKLRSIIESEDKDNADFIFIQKLLDQYNIISYIQSKAAQFAEKARYALDIFPTSNLKDILIHLTYFVINRCN
jgi:octaprenyl-diphosphate synthase